MIFSRAYKQTVLGPLWFIVQPLLNTLVFTIVFNKVAGIATDGIPPLLFYLCALLPWGYFAQNVTTGAATFTTNAHLFGKVYFPRLIVPVSSVISNLFARPAVRGLLRVRGVVRAARRRGLFRPGDPARFRCC